MIYSSLEFLVSFPIFAFLYWNLRSQRARLAALIVGSLLFYAYGEPAGVPLLAGVVLVSYVGGRVIAARPDHAPLVVAIGTAVLLGDLAYFKYSAFASTILPALRTIPYAPFLPLGISFFTFEGIAYLVDLKRKVTRPERSLGNFALYVGVFPHLISGPIMRPNDLLPQLRKQIELRAPTFISGLQLFVEGFLKKRLLADPAGVVADRIFAAPGDAGIAVAWLGALAYTVQIYGDFAGYTDMGRGVARMLGLELPLNFNGPYASESITEFWRRWHISLSSWLRDYLYIGLGGNRKGELRTYTNLIVTMLLGGLWHGAGFTFVAWGAYHGVLLALERVLGWPGRVPRWLSGAVTVFLVVNGWVLFRAQSFSTWYAMVRSMYVPHPGSLELATSQILFVSGAFVVLVGVMVLQRIWTAPFDWLRAITPARGVLYGAVAGLALTFAPTATRTFIYFRF